VLSLVKTKSCYLYSGNYVINR